MFKKLFKRSHNLRSEQIERYTYQPLRDSEIRLVRFVESKSKTIKCTLVPYDFENAPEYVALSYTWDNAVQAADESWYVYDSSSNSSNHYDYSAYEEEAARRQLYQVEQDTAENDPNRRHIICSGKLLAVKRNLFDALKELRRSKDQKCYWIDAICINQDKNPTNTEKAAQVRQMRRIYDRASHILIWLGLPCVLLDDFAWVSEYLSEQFLSVEAGQVSLQRMDLLWKDLDDPELTQRLGLHPQEDLERRIHNFVQFCEERRWFSRLWTVQEANSVSTKINMLCGGRYVSYRGACWAGRLIEHGVWRLHIDRARLGPRRSGTRRMNAAHRMDIQATYQVIAEGTLESRTLTRVRSIFGWDNEEERAIALLAYMVLKTMHFECTNQRDKVYAILAFMQPLLHGSVQQSIPVDYTKSVQEVYTNFGKAVMTVAPRLGLLSFAAAAIRCRREGLPSWVPELTAKARDSRHGSIHPLVDIFESNVYDAMNCAHITGTASARIEGSQIVCQGAFFDEITMICGSSNVQILKHRRLIDLIRFAENLPNLVSGVHKIEALWRTWSGNYCCDYINNIEYYPMEDFSRTDFQYSILELLLSNIFSNRMVEGVADSIGAVLERLDPEQESGALPSATDIALRTLEAGMIGSYEPQHTFETERYRTCMIKIASGRQLFLTRRGLLGMGPAEIEVGLKVCFCHGSLVPLIVRESSSNDAAQNTVELVGDCYLHGFMNGEVLDDQEFREQIGDIRIV